MPKFKLNVGREDVTINSQFSLQTDTLFISIIIFLLECRNTLSFGSDLKKLPNYNKEGKQITSASCRRHVCENITSCHCNHCTDIPSHSTTNECGCLERKLKILRPLPQHNIKSGRLRVVVKKCTKPNTHLRSVQSHCFCPFPMVREHYCS